MRHNDDGLVEDICRWIVSKDNTDVNAETMVGTFRPVITPIGTLYTQRDTEPMWQTYRHLVKSVLFFIEEFEEKNHDV